MKESNDALNLREGLVHFRSHIAVTVGSYAVPLDPVFIKFYGHNLRVNVCSHVTTSCKIFI